ncbi:MAG TPA: hypothetical protein VK171_08120, partial [Fimbriimonas sp.]|nr:hypothetical protein [Fimbriimonas sp.]
MSRLAQSKEAPEGQEQMKCKPAYQTERRCSSMKMSSALLAIISASIAMAQNDKMTAIPTPKQPTAIVLGTGKLPDAPNEEAWHSQYGSVFARNVTVATLTPFLPAKGKANGTAVIVAPGGG